MSHNINIIQGQLFTMVSEVEKKVLLVLKDEEERNSQYIADQTGLEVSRVRILLEDLRIKGMVDYRKYLGNNDFITILAPGKAAIKDIKD